MPIRWNWWKCWRPGLLNTAQLSISVALLGHRVEKRRWFPQTELIQDRFFYSRVHSISIWLAVQAPCGRVDHEALPSIASQLFQIIAHMFVPWFFLITGSWEIPNWLGTAGSKKWEKCPPSSFELDISRNTSPYSLSMESLLVLVTCKNNFAGCHLMWSRERVLS